MGQPYTSGDWRVREGSEQEFIERWTEFLEWSLKAAQGVEFASLIQEKADPRHFISFGAWDNEEAVNAWRRDPEFAKRLGRCRELCEDFGAKDFELVASRSG